MRFVLPDSRKNCSGWIDHDNRILRLPLSIRDKAYYLEKRFNIVFFGPMDNIFLRSAPNHKAVNSPDMSFFLLGTTVLCCAIEAVGEFLLGGGDPGDRFKTFLRAYLPQWSRKTKKRTILPDWMWKHLRNALAHAGAISRGGMVYLGSRRFRERMKGRVEVHTEILYQDFKKAFSRYLADVAAQKDRSQVVNFERRFKEIFIDSQR